MRASPKVGPSDASREEGIPRDDTETREIEAEAARSVAGGVKDLHRMLPVREGIAVIQISVDCRNGRGRQPKQSGLDRKVLAEDPILFMQSCNRSGFCLYRVGGADMIQMGMGMKEIGRFQPMPREPFEDQIALVAGVEHNGDARLFTTDNHAVALKWSDRKRLKNHP